MSAQVARITDGRSILFVEQARDYIARATVEDFADVKGLRDKSAAYAVYQRSQKAGLRTQHDAAEVVLLATRRMGELLAEMPKNEGGRPLETGDMVSPVSTLEDLGISKKESSRAQALAAVPEGKINAYLAACREKGKQVTKGGALALAKEPKEPLERNALVIMGEFNDAIRRVIQRFDEISPLLAADLLTRFAQELRRSEI